MAASWFVYILECADGSLYTGITTDVARRLKEHNGAGKAGAKYTRVRRPVVLRRKERFASRSAAAKREAALKALPRAGKLMLLKRR